MRWVRRNPHEALAAFAFTAGIILMGLAVLSFFGGAESETEAAPESGSNRPYKPINPIVSTVDPVEALETKVAQGKNSLGTSADPQALAGEGGSRGLPRHEVTVAMASQAPISGVGYIIPTSVEDNYGVAKDVGRSWSLSTVVFGDPDYAQLFAQAGARGFPVTCTITVDGKVTERRATEGPYGQLFCQG